MVRKLTWQFSNQGHDPIFNVKKGYKNWTLALNILCNINVGNHIDLFTIRRQIRMDYVRWDKHVDY